MSKSNGLAFIPDAYDPTAYNPNAFNQVVYTRSQDRSELLFFSRPPPRGLSRLEDLVAETGARDLLTGQSADAVAQAGAVALARAGAGDAAQLKYTQALYTARGKSSGPGAVVPFLESCYPTAVMFNTATGAWTSAQAQAAIAAVDRSNVFRALDAVAGQEHGPIVVESPKGLENALKHLAAKSTKALVLSSIAPMCAGVKVVDLTALSASPTDIYDAAVQTSPDHRVVISPFIGLKAQQREICCDGILVNGKIVFAAFSEKARVDPFPPYQDRRIVTVEAIDETTRAGSLDVIRRLVRKLGVSTCVFHGECALTDGKPLLIDFMTRPGGGFIPEMVYAKHGVDLRAAHVYASFSMTKELVRIASEEKTDGRSVAIGSLYASEDAKAKDFAGRDMHAALAGDDRIVAYSVVSEFSNSVAGSTDLRGALCVYGTNSADALQHLEEVADTWGLN